MGGSSNHGPVAGHLFIETPARNYHTGEHVTGTIHLFLTQQVSVRTLVLKFKGTESVVVNRVAGSSYEEFKKQWVNPQYMFDGPVVSQKFPVFQFAEEVTGPGQFSFPFVFVLPRDIPGSFKLGDAVCIAFIKYTLSVCVKGQGSNRVEKHKMILNLMESNISVPSLLDYEESVVSGGCCTQEGVVGVKVTLPKLTYMAGEQIKLTIEVDNSRNRLAIRGLEAALFRVIKVRAIGDSALYRNLKTSRVVVDIPPGAALLGSGSVKIGVTLDDDEHNVPEAVSVRGHLLECVYMVNVIALLVPPKCWMTENPVFVRTIRVLPLQLPVLVPVNVPGTWRPEVLPLVQFDIGGDYHYDPTSSSITS